MVNFADLGSSIGRHLNRVEEGVAFGAPRYMLEVVPYCSYISFQILAVVQYK